MLDLNKQKARLVIIAGKRPPKVHPIPVEKGADMGDIALAALVEGTEILILEKGRMRQVRALMALQKIEEGTYQECSGCDKRISSRRLEAVPEAILCIECQDKQERMFGTCPPATEQMQSLRLTV